MVDQSTFNNNKKMGSIKTKAVIEGIFFEIEAQGLPTSKIQHTVIGQFPVKFIGTSGTCTAFDELLGSAHTTDL